MAIKIKKNCDLCGEKHLEIKKEKIKIIIKGEEIEYEKEVYYCPELDEKFEDGELLNTNLNNGRDAYRKKVGLLTISDIVSIRKEFNLSQRDLAIILGMGEATISRIESKVIQDKSTDDSIRRIKEDPAFLLEKLENNREKLENNYFKIKNTLNYNADIGVYFKKIIEIAYYELEDNMNLVGNTKLNLEKIENMIIYFLNNCKNVYKTKLNKLMWFADALYYKTNGHSITGLAYSHMPFGAVPVRMDEFLKIFESFNKILIKEKENEETGNTFYEITPLCDFKQSLFNNDELNSIEKVAKKFYSFGNREISEYMHNEKAYKESLANEFIDYKLAKELREF